MPINIYIDLSKAFDTLNFDILLNKLDYYGLQGCATTSSIVIFLKDGNLLISVGTNLAICQKPVFNKGRSYDHFCF